MFPFRVRGLVRNVALLAGPLLLAAVPPDLAFAAEDSERAETLFATAQACLDRGDWACACDNFAASMAAEASASTQLNLAKCQMHDGKLADAWRTVQAAMKLNAETAYPDESRRRALAEYGAKLNRELEAGTAELVLGFPARPPGLEVLLDGMVVPAAELEAPMRLNPGRHEILARAQGYVPERSFVIAVAGGRLEVPVMVERTIEPVGTKPVADPPSMGSERPETSDGSQAHLIAGWTVGAVGVAALGTSLAMGIITVLKSNSAEDTTACKSPTDNDRIRSCNDLRDDARSFQSATIGLAVPGAVLLGVGIALLATAPSEPASKPKVALKTRGLGLAMDLQF